MKYVTGLDKGQLFALLDITELLKQQMYDRKFEHSFNMLSFLRIKMLTFLSGSCFKIIFLVSQTKRCEHIPTKDLMNAIS